MKLACAQKASRFLPVCVILPLDTIVSSCSPPGSGRQAGSRVGLFLIQGETVLPVCLSDFYSSVSSLLSLSLCCFYLDQPVKTSVVNP
jgi:hypothetical protein